MKATITAEDLFIPRQELVGFGEIVLEKRGQQFVIRPKNNG